MTANLVNVGEASSVADGSVRVVRVGGKSIALFRVGDELFAMDNHCLHRGGPLAQGGREGFDVVCPWHGWAYDIRSGSFKVIPALKVKTYRVSLQGESIMLDLDGK